MTDELGDLNGRGFAGTKLELAQKLQLLKEEVI